MTGPRTPNDVPDTTMASSVAIVRSTFAGRTDDSGRDEFDRFDQETSSS